MRTFDAIDADGHVMEPESIWPEYLDAAYHHAAPRRVPDNQGRDRALIAGRYTEFIPQNPAWQSGPPRLGGVDGKARLADMDAEGIRASLLFPTTGLYFAGVEDTGAQVALCRAYNDWLYDFCAADPKRLLGVAVVPQANITETVAEVHRTVEQLGFKAVMLRPNPIAGRNLDDPWFDPLWQALQTVDAPVAIHEGTTQNMVQSGYDRFSNFTFRHACSHPHEQQIACLSLICGGVLERNPDLRVAFLESGCGWIAHWLERLDEHMEHWGHCTAPLPHAPSDYFARQCFISADPDERTIPAMASLVGEQTLLFASDYPHPDAIYPGVVKALTEREDVSEGLQQQILVDNPERCFGL